MNRFEGAFEEHEGEPVLEMNMKFNGQQVPLRLDYETTAIFTHAEPYRRFDHVFVELGEDSEERTIGAFIWRQVLPDWDDLKEALDRRDFQHIHSPYPNASDVEQYEQSNLPEPEEPKVIVEAEDEDIVTKAMENWDEEWRYYSGEA